MAELSRAWKTDRDFPSRRADIDALLSRIRADGAAARAAGLAQDACPYWWRAYSYTNEGVSRAAWIAGWFAKSMEVERA